MKLGGWTKHGSGTNRLDFGTDSGPDLAQIQDQFSSFPTWRDKAFSDIKQDQPTQKVVDNGHEFWEGQTSAQQTFFGTDLERDLGTGSISQKGHVQNFKYYPIGGVVRCFNFFHDEV